MWLREFKRTDVQPLIPYDPRPTTESGRQDVVSTERMCFSCHDGFVLDSRFVWGEGGHGHPVGVRPSERVRIPTLEGKVVFPLNEDGKLYCGTCHTAHGVDWTQDESPIFLRMKNVRSSLCVACHLDHGTGPAEGNHPILKPVPERPRALLRAGARFGGDSEVICQSCHRPHGARGDPITVLDNRRSALCSACHGDKGGIRGTRHDLAVVAPGARNARGHTTAETGPCSACHVPHGARGPRLWAREDPGVTAVDASSARCLGCHRPHGVAGRKPVGRHSHPLDVAIEAAGVAVKGREWSSSGPDLPGLAPVRPLPLVEAGREAGESAGAVGCITCHDPHVWSRRHGRTGDPRAEEGDGRNSFLRIANDGESALCTNCHRDQASVALSRHNLGLSRPEATNLAGSSTADSGVCSACHLPHNGDGLRMWARQLPAGSSGVEQACRSCHRDGGPAAEKQTGAHSHPLHVRPGAAAARAALPLFRPDGARTASAGEIDCATCHDPHQWEPGRPASRTGAEAEGDGDAGNSFLRREASARAGLCLSCHPDKRTVLGTDHDLAVSAPRAVDDRGRTVRETGPCGQCHAVHNAVIPARLWARTPGEGADLPARMCLGCHRHDGVAAAKVPRELGHPPRQVVVNRSRLRGQPAGSLLYPPVYGDDGRPVEEGLITCPTCHDPHRWDAAAAVPGPGKPVEGNVLDSFLRHADTRGFLCADCHGPDSLYRYKYFHWDKSRHNQSLTGP